MSSSFADRDPYDIPPPWWQRYAKPLAATAVAILTIVLMVLAFPPYKVPEFAYACLAPGIFWAYRKPAFKLYAWTMLGACAIAWTILLGWLHNVTWVGLALLGPLVGAWVGSWFLAVWWAMPRFLGRGILERLLALFGLAGLWVVIEWTRTWLFSGFPWLPLSASQWERVSILQIAAFTGAWGISFVLVSMNLGFAAYAHRLLCEGQTGLRRRSQEFFASLFLLVVCVTIHVQETFNRGQFSVPMARVAFVQPYVPQMQKWDPAFGQSILNTLDQLTLQAAANRPDVILWPEASTPWAVRGDAQMQAWVESLAQRSHSTLLMGSVAWEKSSQADDAVAYNGAFIVDPTIGVQTACYYKQHLVPFGEYLPFQTALGWLRKVEPIGENLQAGENPQPLVLNVRGNSLPVGVLICYEDVFPNLAATSVRMGAEVLVVLTNNAWFGEGGAAYQHAAHSVLRAVETRRPVLRCGNGGWSGWIDEFGNVRSMLKNREGSIYLRGTDAIGVFRDIRWITQQSFYVRHGDWFVALSAALVALGFAALRIGGAKTNRKNEPPISEGDNTGLSASN